MAETFRGGEILFWNERRTAFVLYQVFDLGKKYKVYTERDGVRRFVEAYGTQGEAMREARKIF